MKLVFIIMLSFSVRKIWYQTRKQVLCHSLFSLLHTFNAVCGISVASIDRGLVSLSIPPSLVCIHFNVESNIKEVHFCFDSWPSFQCSLSLTLCYCMLLLGCLTPISCTLLFPYTTLHHMSSIHQLWYCMFVPVVTTNSWMVVAIMTLYTVTYLHRHLILYWEHDMLHNIMQWLPPALPYPVCWCC